MRRVVHLSDLHFGRANAALETPLLETLHALGPDLVAISGDFTQRARVAQFEHAADFVARIGPPVLSVPGNHDTPLDNLWVRMMRPWARYRAAIHRNLEPTFEDDEMIVVGVNTVNRFAWQRGRISSHTVNRVCKAFADAGDRARIVVLHHPLEHLPEVEKRLMKGARAAVAQLADCGADVVLSGHLHNSRIAPHTSSPGLLLAQAGTGLSDRVRGERNTFNLLTITRGEITVATYAADDNLRFHPATETTYRRGEDGWAPAIGDTAAEAPARRPARRARA